MSDSPEVEPQSDGENPNKTSLLLLITQILGGTVLALLLAGIASYLWLLIELGEVDCQLDFMDLAGSGYGACIETFRGAPELLLGNLLILFGAVFGVAWIGLRQDVIGSRFLAAIVSIVAYAGTQSLMGTRVIDPLKMLVDLAQFQVTVAALQPALIASVSATLGYYLAGLWEKR